MGNVSLSQEVGLAAGRRGATRARTNNDRAGASDLAVMAAQLKSDTGTTGKRPRLPLLLCCSFSPAHTYHHLREPTADRARAPCHPWSDQPHHLRGHCVLSILKSACLTCPDPLFDGHVVCVYDYLWMNIPHDSQTPGLPS